jgi:hypothetical protein
MVRSSVPRFDVVSRECGPGSATRDLYLGLRACVQEAMHAVDPHTADLVVDNPGTAISDCCLAPGRRTADALHVVPGAAAMRTTLDTAFTRGAGYAHTTSPTMPNPWKTPPTWPHHTQTTHATTLG